MLFRKFLTVRAEIFLGMLVFFVLSHPISSLASPSEGGGALLQKASLEECLQTAFQNNHRRPASRYALEMAEAQHRQALGPRSV